MTAHTPDSPEVRAALALPTKEAAALLGVAESTVRARRKRANIPPPPTPGRDADGRILPKLAPAVNVRFRFPADLLARVDETAALRGCSRTAVVVDAVKREVGA